MPDSTKTPTVPDQGSGPGHLKLFGLLMVLGSVYFLILLFAGWLSER